MLRQRITPALASDVAAWVRANSGPGGWFYGDGHAFEVALARLRAEQDHVRALCSEHGVRFDAKVFWATHRDTIAASRPHGHGGARQRGVSLEDRTRVFANVDESLLKWALALCSENATPTRPFASVGHVIETALRNLQAQGNPQLPGDGAPLDVSALWARYEAYGRNQ